MQSLLSPFRGKPKAISWSVQIFPYLLSLLQDYWQGKFSFVHRIQPNLLLLPAPVKRTATGGLFFPFLQVALRSVLFVISEFPFYYPAQQSWQKDLPAVF